MSGPLLMCIGGGLLAHGHVNDGKRDGVTEEGRGRGRAAAAEEDQ